MERSGVRVLFGAMSETGFKFARAKRLQANLNVGRPSHGTSTCHGSLKRKCRTARDANLCLCFGYAVSSAAQKLEGRGESARCNRAVAAAGRRRAATLLCSDRARKNLSNRLLFLAPEIHVALLVALCLQ